MTAIAGFYCSDGVLVCSDMEESSGYSKRSVHKLYHKTFGSDEQAWDVVIGGAGSSVVIDNLLGRLKGAFERMVPFDNGHFCKAVQMGLRKVYEDYVWPNQTTDHGFRLVIGVSPIRTLITTADIVPAVEHQAQHVAIGVGADMVNYFADRLFKSEMSSKEAILLATFIFREVKEAVADCGKRTEMWFLPSDTTQAARYIEPGVTRKLENMIPDSSLLLEAMWATVKHDASTTVASIKPSASQTSMDQQ